MKGNKEVHSVCDTLLKLQNGMQESYNIRRTYEWKMCFSIWTFIFVFTGVILTKPNISLEFYLHMIFSIIIFFIHLIWQLNLKISNDIDVSKIKSYKEKIHKLLGSEEPKKDRKGLLIFNGWSHAIYIVITIILLITSLIVVDNQQQSNITLPNDIQNYLEEKHLTDIQEKQKYIIKKLRCEMDSERKANLVTECI